MRVCVVLEARFDRTPQGEVYGTGPLTYDFWKRYLKVFDSVRVVARLRRVQNPRKGLKPVSGPGVDFFPVPYYVGPLQYGMRAISVRRAVRAAVGPKDALILRMPSQLASSITAWLRRSHRPYAVELVGDPYDVFSPGGVDHWARLFFRRWFYWQTKHLCHRACAVGYVTERYLQQRYPPESGAFVTSYSDVVLDDEAFTSTPRLFTADAVGSCVTIGSAGTMDAMYKGFDVLIKAASRLVRLSLPVPVRVVIAGDGKFRHQLEHLSRSLGLDGRVSFVGRVDWPSGMRSFLDSSGLFILPSRTEGLPRVMIEAMARGLPCLGTRVGGIPELLPTEDLVESGDADALARKIADVISDPARMSDMSARNLRKARAYRDDVLDERRAAFLRCLRDIMQGG